MTNDLAWRTVAPPRLAVLEMAGPLARAPGLPIALSSPRLAAIHAVHACDAGKAVQIAANPRIAETVLAGRNLSRTLRSPGIAQVCTRWHAN